ncbi:hypothetical protein QZH41_019813 [Actinostola sp. cb2023]|nr:hypothetical protein QZH41_019813 [Actinostola sp. cb2023]
MSVKNPNRVELKEIGQTIFSNYNKICNENLGKSFSDILTLVPEAGLIKKQSPVERKKENRESKRKLKKKFLFVITGKRIRRAILKQKGKEISFSIPRQNILVQDEIKQKIASGEFNLGVPVLETNDVKLVITSEGLIEKKQTALEARKYPFGDIRRNSLHKNDEFMKIKADEVYDNMSKEDAVDHLKELNANININVDKDPVKMLKDIERTRNWLMWHDHSGLGNRGMMLFLVREVYDPAIHMTNQEYQQKNSVQVDVQSVIEEPHLYMMGLSGSSDADQMLFIPTRRECLQSFSQPVESKDGIAIQDKMRFMNGDNPSVEYEDGTQKGGHRGCAGCDGDIRMAGQYDYMAYRQYKTLEEKCQLVMAGIEGKKGNLYPFHNLIVQQLRDELDKRGEDSSGLKPVLQERLTELLGGTTKLPALLYGTELTLSDLNLQDYEVLFVEPLHCCLNHISNILQELPHHIQDVNSLIVLKETMSVSLNKNKLRCTDYRKALLQITIQLSKQPNVPADVMELLLTLCEMMGILYADESKRNPKQILRLYNLAFRHALAVNSVLFPVTTMTARKMQGIHYHQMIDHAALIYRMVCLKSINAELFERYFDRIQDITQKTWSKQPKDLVSNAFLHVHAEDAIDGDRSAMRKQEKEISKLARHLPKSTNTIIKAVTLKKNSRVWQAHIQKIPDYLKHGPDQWWNERDDGSIEFLDGPSQDEVKPCGPHLSHFRSTTIQDLQQQLNTEWEQIKVTPEILPVMKLRDEEGKLVYPAQQPEEPIVNDDEHSPEMDNSNAGT